ncbi:ATP-binding protein [Zhenpiania hominis]|uniref:ATP-binding protein n=1 Tax=Zhenpiania hominis TaxID=2763644 RepID=UPI0039F48548
MERLSTVLMLPISSFAKKFVKSDPSVFKVVLLDESWALKKTSMGQALYEYLARTGRSQNASAIFIGHSVGDVSEKGIREALTYKFIFRVNTREEAEQACTLLNIEATDATVDLLQNLQNGHCLFQDLEGNVDELEFDAVYEHLIQAFNTNPTNQKSDEKPEDEEERED